MIENWMSPQALSECQAPHPLGNHSGRANQSSHYEQATATLAGLEAPLPTPHPAVGESAAISNVFPGAGGRSISNCYIAPLFFKMAQNLDLRCVLVPAPGVLRPKHVSNLE